MEGGLQDNCEQLSCIVAIRDDVRRGLEADPGLGT
mgnify:CR=1 FL=1